MTNNYIKLYVNIELREWGWGAGVNVNFDSPRLGGWQSGDNQDRSLQGMLASFRVWSVETDGSDSCPDASTTGLLVAYDFNEAGALPLSLPLLLLLLLPFPPVPLSLISLKSFASPSVS